ncbi:RNA-binding protein 20 [Labeo rohita]|uniref:RNA-binding protein 20 n=1 Tax=Labeo rohita TaxID=84645 RepID=A0ABQ8MMV7_LABRO|nr:RNA-binding protein 20 [Labeo rohita]
MWFSGATLSKKDDVCLLSVDGLQCYGCNVFHGQKYVDVGCTNPEVITCTHSHKGFKHRFCIKTESTQENGELLMTAISVC